MVCCEKKASVLVLPCRHAAHCLDCGYDFQHAITDEIPGRCLVCDTRVWRRSDVGLVVPAVPAVLAVPAMPAVSAVSAVPAVSAVSACPEGGERSIG